MNRGKSKRMSYQHIFATNLILCTVVLEYPCFFHILLGYLFRPLTCKITVDIG